MKKIIRLIVMALIVCIGVLCFTACGDKPYVADNTEHYDAITKTLKLNKSYADKCFFTDGIGSAKVSKYTDGDTTTFVLDKADSKLGSVVTIRYYAIDTPESTGGVEKWGKAASQFTKKQLESATEIVLEATATPAETDSNGTRYLGYVWYKTADYSDFKCLNLEIVENGFSENRGQNTSSYPYDSYFEKANEFAKSIQLRLYSELADPLFNDDPVDITIKEFWEDTSLFYDDEEELGIKVRFHAYLKSLNVSGSPGSETYTFVAEEYDEETGKTYQINVYAGYNSAPGAAMILGHYYQIVGTVQKYSNNYQVSGIVYSLMYPADDNTHIEQMYYYWTFNNSASTSNNTGTLYSDLTVTSVDVDGTVMTIVGTAQRYTTKGYTEAAEYTFTVKVDEGYTPSISAGNRIAVNAYKFDSSDTTLTILDVNSIIKR